jgi:hypothetical protein
MHPGGVVRGGVVRGGTGFVVVCAGVGACDVVPREDGAAVRVAEALLDGFAEPVPLGAGTASDVAAADATGCADAEVDDGAAGVVVVCDVGASSAAVFPALDWQAVVPKARSNAAAMPANCRLTVGSPPECAGARHRQVGASPRTRRRA